MGNDRSSNGLAELERRLWDAADQLWANSSLRPSEYSTPVLGLIFLRFADNAFTKAESKLKGKSTGRRAIGKTDYQATRLALRPEPTNPHDSFAVDILHGPAKPGYFPRFCNRHISRLLQDAVALTCQLDHLDPNAPPWDAVSVRIRRLHPPESIYYKTLFHIFEKFLGDARKADTDLGATTLFDTEIWKALFDVQKDGVKGMINKMLAHSGCILADSVGLGKT
jgi:hypothetical protein